MLNRAAGAGASVGVTGAIAGTPGGEATATCGGTGIATGAGAFAVAGAGGTTAARAGTGTGRAQIPSKDRDGRSDSLISAASGLTTADAGRAGGGSDGIGAAAAMAGADSGMGAVGSRGGDAGAGGSDAAASTRASDGAGMAGVGMAGNPDSVGIRASASGSPDPENNHTPTASNPAPVKVPTTARRAAGDVVRRITPPGLTPGRARTSAGPGGAGRCGWRGLPRVRSYACRLTEDDSTSFAWLIRVAASGGQARPPPTKSGWVRRISMR